MQKSANNLFIDADSLGLLFAFSLLCNDEVLKLSANFFQEDMKAKVRAAIGRPDYNATWLNSKSFHGAMHFYGWLSQVIDFYKTSGRCQQLARKRSFEHITLAVILFNAAACLNQTANIDS